MYPWFAVLLVAGTKNLIQVPEPGDVGIPTAAIGLFRVACARVDVVACVSPQYDNLYA